MKILLIGANGQLGYDLKMTLTDHEIIPLTHKDVEVTDWESIKVNMERYKPQLVINTSAYNKVDAAEDEMEKAFAVNAYGVKYLASLCELNDCQLVHFSTDYVFNGEQKIPYTESDIPCPLNAYGISKLAGEHFALNFCSRSYVIRTCGLYGTAGCSGKGGSFIDTMFRLAGGNKEIKVVNDQILTPTSTRELASQVYKLIESDTYGLYHITNNGECSWYEFAKEIFGIKNLNVNLIPVTSEEFKTKARRAKYSVLENYKLKKMDIDRMSDWKTALKNHLESL